MIRTSQDASQVVLQTEGRSEPLNIVQAAYERKRQESKVENTIDLSVSSNTILHPPVLLQGLSSSMQTTKPASPTESAIVTNIPAQKEVSMAIGSSNERNGIVAAQAIRRYLAAKRKYYQEEKLIRRLNRSMAYQKQVHTAASQQIEMILRTEGATIQNDRSEVARMTTDQWDIRQQEANRVIAQLGRKLEGIILSHTGATKTALEISKRVAHTLSKEAETIKGVYLDPDSSTFPKGSLPVQCLKHGLKSNSAIFHLMNREYGIQSSRGFGRVRGGINRTFGLPASPRTSCKRQVTMLSSRLSHVVTINSHLFYPVYCLRFDRTGQYFVTGADDNVAKLFRLGSLTSDRRGRDQRLDRGHFSIQRGATLICSLRGHAGVITDIDISADNALVATASEDGDVRVWGLTNGCPVAILRGHRGGANMVSWSALTPFRLVTAGQDGFARMWDIREAALKRCASINSRRDYTLNDTGLSRRDDKVASIEENNEESMFEQIGNQLDTTEDCYELPSIPQPNQSSTDVIENDPPNLNRNENVVNGINVPPLPVGAGNGLGDGGAFIFNDEIDEGVSLLSLLQHGKVSGDEQFTGAETRTRSKPINVVCLTRCPTGGHFATGSDNGVARIWLDLEEKKLSQLDESFREDNSLFQMKEKCTLSRSHNTCQRTRTNRGEEYRQARYEKFLCRY